MMDTIKYAMGTQGDMKVFNNKNHKKAGLKIV